MQKTGALKTSLPLSMFVWCKPTAVSGVDYCLLCLGRLNDSYGGWSLEQRGFTWFTDRPNAIVDHSYGPAYATGSPAAGAWNSVGAVFASDTSRACYVNGANKGISTANYHPWGPPQYTTIGRFGPRNPQRYYSGLLGYACFWDIALSDGEMATLATGVPPWTVQTANVLACYDMTVDGSLGVPIYGAGTLTETNITYSTDNPPVAMAGGVYPWWQKRQQASGIWTPGRM